MKLEKNNPKAHCYFKISRATFLLFWPFLISKVLEVYFDLCLFFSWVKINFAFQKSLADFFLVKPWPLQQPAEAKLLISVCLLKGQKFSFYCKISYELQFAGLAWDLTNFYSKETRIVENASLCTTLLIMLLLCSEKTEFHHYKVEIKPTWYFHSTLILYEPKIWQSSI